MQYVRSRFLKPLLKICKSFTAVIMFSDGWHVGCLNIKNHLTELVLILPKYHLWHCIPENKTLCPMIFHILIKQEVPCVLTIEKTKLPKSLPKSQNPYKVASKH